MTQGICPVCNETVRLLVLTFSKHSGIKKTGPEEKTPVFLCAEHPAKAGCKTTSIVSEQSGEIVKTICDGSTRPGKEFVH